MLIVILFGLTTILTLIFFGSKSKVVLKIIGYSWLFMFGVIVLAVLSGIILGTKQLDRDDYDGQYIINRTYFKGKQADWQYENFRFEIKDNDTIYFYVTDKDKILHTFKGSVKTVKPYNSERLMINMIQPTHHILMTNPIIYRDTWNFNLVFNSPKFGNMYFIKGEWTPIEKQ